MTVSPFGKVKDTRTKLPADLSRGGTKSSYTKEEKAKAVDILAMRADFLAEEIGIKDDRGPHYRDWSGTAHLLIRSIVQSLDRIANNQHDSRKAKGAASTVGFILDNPDKVGGMLCDDPVRLAELGDKISDAELAGKPLNEAVSQADLNYVVGQLYKFTYDISQTLRIGNPPENKADLEKYAQCLDKGVQWVADAHKSMERKLNPELAMSSAPKQEL